MGFILDEKDIGQPDGITLKTFVADNIPSFKSHGKIKKHLHIVNHENAGSTNIFRLRNWLLKKGYGYLIIIDRTGTVQQHNDLRDKLWHASQCNPTGVGICLVNPYYPKNISLDLEENYIHEKAYRIINAQWWTHCSPKKRRAYVRPTPAQLEALKKVVPFLCDALGVPVEYPTIGLSRKKRKVFGWQLRRRPKPGIVAHRDFSRHADGRFALEYLHKNQPQVCPECKRPL